MARSKKTAIDKFKHPFARRLWQLMHENGTTQDALAAAVEKTRQTVSQYVNGVSEPGYDTLVKIADYFQVSADYLLGRTETQSPDISIQAITALTGLSEDNVSTLCQNHTPGDPTNAYQAFVNDVIDVIRSDNEHILSHYFLLRLYACEAENYDSDFYNDDAEKKYTELKEHGYAVIPSTIAMRFSCNRIGVSIENYLFGKYLTIQGGD